MLGYSDKAAFSVTGMPVQLRLWLQRLKEGVRAMEKGTVAVRGVAKSGPKVR